MIKLLILTTHYPWTKKDINSESFFELEVSQWAQCSNIEVTVMPRYQEVLIREAPDGITIDDCLTKESAYLRVYSYVRACFSILLLKEMLWLLREGRMSIGRLKSCFKEATYLFRYKYLLQKAFKQKGSPDVVYSYWCTTPVFSALLLKRQGAIKRVLTRAHSYDLYEFRSRYDYKPFVRHFLGQLDDIYAVSEHGKNYLESHYSVASRKVRVSYLGVSLSNYRTRTSEQGNLTILSVSSCTQVKQVDKIIDAIRLVSTMAPQLGVSWTHIGDGPLFTSLREYANKHLKKQSNVAFEFLGFLENRAVLDYYECNSVDVFINVSAIEGVPVSIMEALSYGVPVIAADVGGNSELLQSGNGILLQPNPEVQEIAQALLEIDRHKSVGVRNAALQKMKEKFDAQKNFVTFINDVLQSAS